MFQAEFGGSLDAEAWLHDDRIDTASGEAMHTPLDVRQGEIVGLIGPNGAGKTTLFAAIAGFHTPDAGSVRFEGKDITGLPPHRICGAGMVRTFQINQLFAD